MKQVTQGTRVRHAGYGEGIVSRINITNYEIFFENAGRVTIAKDSDEMDILDSPAGASDAPAGTPTISVEDFEAAITHVLDKYIGLPVEVFLSDRWSGGTLILQPANPELQTKEMPIETFFHKIVMMRDKLRVLEQNINSNSKLDDTDKVQLQQYISRIYGSFTSFNVLFANKEDQFSSK